MGKTRQKTHRKAYGDMKIVICDDNMEDLLHIEKLLQKYADCLPEIDFNIEKYSDSSKLYNRIQQKELADIYLLDMVMSHKTGIDIATQLRKTGSDSVVICITSSDDFALDAYQVHAARYLLKPVREPDFFEALDYALSHMETKKGPVYLVKTREGLVSPPYSKIEYVENAARALEIHLTDGSSIRSIFLRKSFDEEIGKLLEDKSFLQIHKSFVIHLKYVEKLMPDRVVMESGKVLPISKTRAAGVKKKYLLFVSEQYR